MKVLNPESGRWEEHSTQCHIEVGPGGRCHRVIVVGDLKYLDRYQNQFKVTRAALLGAYPNPFRARLAIRYAVPYGNVKECCFAVYSLSGRSVWETRLENLYPGNHMLTWDGRSSNGTAVAAGTYIFRMKVKYGDRRKESIFQKTLLFAP
jgi:hypothetical protein